MNIQKKKRGGGNNGASEVDMDDDVMPRSGMGEENSYNTNTRGARVIYATAATRRRLTTETAS
jgi:hypothetical protein